MNTKTVRKAARARQPLDGADAQALEAALTSVELAAANSGNDLLAIALLCKMRDDEYPRQAIERHIGDLESQVSMWKECARGLRPVPSVSVPSPGENPVVDELVASAHETDPSVSTPPVDEQRLLSAAKCLFAFGHFEPLEGCPNCDPADPSAMNNALAEMREVLSESYPLRQRASETGSLVGDYAPSYVQRASEALLSLEHRTLCEIVDIDAKTPVLPSEVTSPRSTALRYAADLAEQTLRLATPRTNDGMHNSERSGVYKCPRCSTEMVTHDDMAHFSEFIEKRARVLAREMAPCSDNGLNKEGK